MCYWCYVADGLCSGIIIVFPEVTVLVTLYGVRGKMYCDVFMN